MKREEEYERWLAELINEALALLRRKIPKPPFSEVAAVERSEEARERRIAVGQKAICDEAVEASRRPEHLSLQMIGLFTLLAMHADIDINDVSAPSKMEGELPALDAMGHLAVALDNAKLGRVEVAREHVKAALHRLDTEDRPLDR